MCSTIQHLIICQLVNTQTDRLQHAAEAGSTAEFGQCTLEEKKNIP